MRKNTTYIPKLLRSKHIYSMYYFPLSIFRIEGV